MAAVAVPQIGFPIKLNRNRTVTFKARKLENHLKQQLSYTQTEACTLVDEITSLVRENKKSALRTAVVEREAPHLVNVMLQSVDPSERLRFIQIQAGGVYGLHRIATYNLETYRQILQSVSSDDERLQLLRMEDSDGWTVLHYAAANSAKEKVQVILESVNEEMRYTLLNMQDDYEWTPICLAYREEHSEMLEVMMRLITVEMRYKLLQLTDEDGHTPLHWSAGLGCAQFIRVIADSASSQQLIHLLRITDSKRRTPLQTAAHYNQHAELELLQYYQTKALIDVALQQTEQSVKDQQICEIVEHKPLNQGQIEELSPYSSQYVIPHNQTKTKRYGLILYNAEDRHGADEEADNFKQALETAGCDVIKLQWSNTSDLGSMIDSSLTRIVGDCSLLIVAVMTHGYTGALSGSEGSNIPINDLLFHFKQELPQCLPLVMVVQACQIFTTQGIVTHQPEEYESDPATPSHVIDPHNNKHIVLRRPHTVLLLATVTGGLAIRGAFTGALADQIRAADGRTDIYTMFNRAVDNMNTHEQRPEMRITTQKALILPPAVNNIASD